LGQEKGAGPVIRNFGEVWKVENTTFATDTAEEFKVVFDVMDSPDSHMELNRTIETAARFLNMHVQNGIPAANLKVYLVVHNKATKDILDDPYYEDRFGMPNPNSALIKDLLRAGVGVVLCGQSSVSRQMPATQAIDGVQLALSAMTALVQLQNEGYQLIKF
jgi:intracellular sulfur oxidation DsrE/DsrF family protein